MSKKKITHAEIDQIKKSFYFRKNYVTTNEAMKVLIEKEVFITLPTLIRWCTRHYLGRRFGARWYIDKVKLKRFLEGETYVREEKPASN